MKHRRRSAALREKSHIGGRYGTEPPLKTGLPRGSAPEAWCLANPEAGCSIHASYREPGGSRYSATFGANRSRWVDTVANVREMNRELAAVAKRVSGEGSRAGISPHRHFVEPWRSPL